MKIAIAGTGYVGLSSGVLLAQHNEVVCFDSVPEKVAMLNRKESPIEDAKIEDFLKNKPLNFRATLDKQVVDIGADYVIIATPTDCDPENNYFDTQYIEAVIRDVMAINPVATMVITPPFRSATSGVWDWPSARKTSSSCPNSCAKAGRFATTYIPAASSLVNIPLGRNLRQGA